MKHIFLDFEMNPIDRKQYKEQFNIVHNEIVEIGAVKLDANYVLIDRFCTYVKPTYNIISNSTTKITGITNKAVADAPEIEEVLARFVAWIGTEPVRIYAWSGSDLKQLRGECLLKGLYPERLPKQLRRWMDFQRVYTRIMGISGKLSLKNAVGSVDNRFEGKQHSALDDAENSATLLTLVKNKERFEQRTKIIQETFRPSKPQGTTLGDMMGSKLSDLLEKLREEETNKN